mgnify:CR=1 FL=1
MKGLEVYISTDYSTGPGPRVVVKIDCDEFNFDHSDEEPDVKVEFIFLKDTIEKIKAKFHLRDYYSIETYYRFFIPNMFPQYDKVLYLDCDIAVLGDIAELYNTDISDCLLGAVSEEVMTEVKVFGDYV